MVLVALAPSFWLLLALFATIVPLGAAFAGYLPATVLAVRMSPGHTGFINGLISLGLALAPVAMAAFAAPLIGLVGWRWTFLVAAAVVVAVIAPVGWFLMDVQAGAPARTMRKAATPGAVSAEGFDALKQPLFWVLLLAAMPILIALGAVPPNLAAVAADSGFDAGHAALLVSAFALGCAAGCLVGGWMADRLPPRMVYAGVLIAVILVLVIMAQRPSWIVMMVALGVFGLAGGSLMPLLSAIVMRTFGPEGFGRVIGLLPPFFIPATFAPILFGWIRDTTGGYQAGFLVFAALVAPGGLCLLLLRPAARPALAPAE
jgi:OFA family oxalate/formate antiporter-like MFS transporter